MSIRIGLAALLAAACAGWGPQARAAAPPTRTRFPALSSAETWDRMRREEPPLPAWSRVLARSLPQATAAMIQLDQVHRATNPLGPVLSAKLRWVAADADRCDYAKRYAEADLRRAGVSDGERDRLTAGKPAALAAERAALALARKMALDASKVTDGEVAELLEAYGPEKVVAMVHTLAHASFQHRIFLALGTEVEIDGPLSPLQLRLDPRGAPRVRAPRRPPWREAQAGKIDLPPVGPDWLGRGHADVRGALRRQQARKARIPMPNEKRLASLPPEMKARASKIVWSRVSVGYQPLLTRSWFEFMGTFQRESALDPLFENTLFWVITRSNDCFY